MLYNLPDLIYAVNRFSIHDFPPSAPYLQGIKHLIRYLSVWTHCTIMYHTGLDVTTTHDLHQEASPGEFHSQNISNGLVAFSDGG